jgi:hypothetical protein
MRPGSASTRAVPAFIRIAAVALGGVLVVVMLFGDRVGLGDRGAFGVTQAAGLTLGVGLVVLGWAGPRLPGLYRGTALVLLNSLVLLVVLEFGAALFLMFMSPAPLTSAPDDADPPEPAYYAAQSWAKTYWRELELARENRLNTYFPYQLWRLAPFTGQTIHVGVDGLRETPGAECVQGAYMVSVFGGSTVWGYGTPDWGTVPAYLQAGLAQALERPVCVRNFGQLGWNSTQDLIALIRELHAGGIPDVAVFLSGVNDVIPAWEAGAAGVPFGMVDIAAKFESRDREKHFLEAFNLYRLARSFLPREQPRGQPRFRYTFLVSDTLAESISRSYLTNYRSVEGLARQYRFSFRFFWQPNLLAGQKPRTAEEEGFKSAARVAPMMELVYRRLASVGPPEYPALHNLMDLFASDSSPVYVDWHHLTPEGNRKVAEAMLPLLLADERRRIAGAN